VKELRHSILFPELFYCFNLMVMPGQISRNVP